MHFTGNSEAQKAKLKLIYVAKLKLQGRPVPYRFSDRMVHDGDWHQVTSKNSVEGDVSYFEGYARPYRAHVGGGSWFSRGNRSIRYYYDEAIGINIITILNTKLTH